MAIRKIIDYPNLVLSTIGAPVTQFDGALEQLTNDMFDTMYAAEGVGLAASQIGVSLRLFVADCEGVKLVAANPTIIRAGGVQEGAEGCLSLASVFYPLQRAQSITLRAENLQGQVYEIEGQGLLARCFLHETDHCDGKLFIHHLSSLQRNIVIRKFLKARKSRQFEE
jgi:peptide deformylase